MIKNSVGIWAFGPAVTRFVPPGYHNEVANEPMVEKTERVAGGLHDLLEGLEYHYPGEINEDNVEEIERVLAAHGMDLPMIAAGLHPDPTYALGAFINPDEGLRRRGIDTLRRGIDLCARVGANFIIWSGAAFRSSSRSSSSTSRCRRSPTRPRSRRSTSTRYAQRSSGWRCGGAPRSRRQLAVPCSRFPRSSTRRRQLSASAGSAAT